MVSPVLDGAASSIVLLSMIAGFGSAAVYGVRAVRAGSTCLRANGATPTDRARAVLGIVLGAGALAVELILVTAMFTGRFNP